jgi:peptidoglycan/xylan/chitin deacetylase (PgdA/CDA1 family)
LFKSSQKEKIRVLITFDDGYKGNFDYAFPILKKYNCPATIFITTGYIDRAILPWRAGLHYLLHNNKESSIRDTINFQREKIKKDQNVLNWSKQNFSSELYKTINDLLIQEPGINKLYDVFLTWEQIRTMYQSSLISFGLHSVTHQIMSKLIFDEQVQEIVTGVESFWKNLQIEPDGFAYPFGGKSHFNQDTIAALKRNLPGKPGFMLGNGVNKVGYTNNYTIQRLCVHDWTTSELSNSMFTNHLKVNN